MGEAVGPPHPRTLHRGRSHAHSRTQRIADPVRPGDPHRGALPALLAAGAARRGAAGARLRAGALEAARGASRRFSRHPREDGADPGPHPGAPGFLGQRHRQDAASPDGRGERRRAGSGSSGPRPRGAACARHVDGGVARAFTARGHRSRAQESGRNRIERMKPEIVSGARRRALHALLAVASLAAPAFAAAQDSRGALAGLAVYDGVDRHQRLLEGARREGFLSLYTSFPPEDVATLNAAFERKYGVKVRAWRAASEKVLQRIVAEAQAGRDEVDLVDSNSVPLELLRRQGLLQAVRSPYHADLIPAAVPAHREWAWARLSVFVQASDEDWFAEVVRNLGEENGLKLFRDLAAKNGLSVRRGHSLLAQMVASGEVPFALTVYNFTADQLKRQGAPLEWFMLSPAVAHGNGFAVIKRAPHPHAALLYYEFMIGDDGQRILAERKSVPTSRKIHTALDRSTLKIIDPVVLVDQGERWTKLYEEIIVKGKPVTLLIDN